MRSSAVHRPRPREGPGADAPGPMPDLNANSLINACGLRTNARELRTCFLLA